jgi:hypothetical protein
MFAGFASAAVVCLASGCPVEQPEATLSIGLTGWVGVETNTQPGAGVPQVGPVAVWLSGDPVTAAPDSARVEPLSGAVVQLRVGRVLVAETATNARGTWELPERPDGVGALAVQTPVGLFDTLAPAPVVANEGVAITGLPYQKWPPVPRRVSRDSMLGGVSVDIEGAIR